MNGFVYLVGAGPGDPGLLTLRGKEILERAEAVIYDSLVHTDILENVPPEAVQERMGKTGHGEQQPQEEITRRLIELARQGKRVVRLKGGDPCLFGRMGEEAVALAEAGIPVEVVPGVTAASGAAAYAGIPLTHRDYAPCVTLVTGHRRADGGSRPSIDWDALAKVGGTIAVYMGIRELPEVCRVLIAGGRPAETPAALIHRATWPEQRVVEGTLGTLPRLAEESKVTAPAIAIVGDVTKVRRLLNWFDRSPLKGKQILVTRAAAQAGQLTHLLKERGAVPIELPLIELRPYGHKSVVEPVLRKMFSYDWVIFSSVNAVEFTFAKLREMGLDARTLGAARVCAVGPKTRDALEAVGIRADVMPTEYVAEALVAALRAGGDLGGKSILIPRAKEGRETAPKELAKLGAKVEVLPIYENVRPEPHPLALEVVRARRIDAVTLASPSAATNYAELLDREGIPRGFAPCVVIGPSTKTRAAALGLPVAAMPSEYTVEGMVDSLTAYFAASAEGKHTT